MPRGRQRSEKPNRRRPQPGDRPAGPHDPTDTQRAQRILKDFYELARTIGEDYGLSRGEDFPLESITIPVTLSLDSRPSRQEREERAAALANQFRHRVQEATQALHAFRMGHVYCFQCEAPDCRHSAPPGPEHAFSGYTPTGKPSWQTVPNLLLALGDERVERLYGDFPEVVALAQGAEELQKELLPGFGSGSFVYNVLGQVVAGLVPADLVPRSDAPRVALTLQFVETRSGNERTRLRLNILGLSPDDLAGAADSGPPRCAAARVNEALRAARQRLSAIGRQVVRKEQRGSDLDRARKLQPVLQQLRGDLERIFRPHRARTHHARDHHARGERPIAQALQDAARASDDRFLLDLHNRTVVVLGPKSRAHVFSPAGLHVTSLQLAGGEVERKVARRRWGPLELNEVARFRKTLRPAREEDQ